MSWLFITLICALALAGSDALAKRYLQGYSARELVLIRFSLSGLLLLPLLPQVPLADAPAAFWQWMALLVLLELAAMLLYMKAIRDYPLALTLPYLSFTPVFAILTGWLLLGEQVSANGLGGIALITLGAWLLNLHLFDRLRLRTLFSPLLAMFHNPGSLMMLGAALIYSFTLSASKKAMQFIPPSSAFGAFYFVLVGTAALLLVLTTQPRAISALWRRPLPALAVAGLMALMVVTHFIAVSLVEAAYMVAVKRTSLLFGILIGAWWFKEANLKRNLPAALLMVLGVAFIII
ncbi:MAG: DMT family transporter [Gammaproteobacteria bacterium SHHR-1]|uniref:DMT family transporter n=1 Tax=Magnetovirga frankeli TaxID=947516 RepID=UPI0012934886|nr:EamA family transporter [gamma proteobacterium SS-5]